MIEQKMNYSEQAISYLLESKKLVLIVLYTLFALCFIFLSAFTFMESLKEDALKYSLFLSVLSDLTAVLIVSIISIHFYDVYKKKQDDVKDLRLREALSDSIDRYRRVEQFDFIMEFTTYKNIDFNKLLSNAYKVDFVAQSLNDFLKHQKEELQEIINNNGIINLFLPDYSDLSLMKQASKRIDGINSTQMSKKIKQTISGFNKLNKSEEEQSITCITYNHEGFYWALRINDKILVISFYEFRRLSDDENDIETVDAPTWVIDLAKNEQMKNWFNNEISTLEG